MSYIPTTWESGDTITSQKLNKMEQGIVSAEIAEGITPLEVNYIYDETLHYLRFDTTFGEIYSAFFSGRPIIVYFDEGGKHDDIYNRYYLVHGITIVEKNASNKFVGSVDCMLDSYSTDEADTQDDVYDLYPHQYIE